MPKSVIERVISVHANMGIRPNRGLLTKRKKYHASEFIEENLTSTGEIDTTISRICFATWRGVTRIAADVRE